MKSFIQVATFIMVLHQFFFVFRKYLFIKYLHLGGKEKNVKNFWTTSRRELLNS